MKRIYLLVICLVALLMPQFAYAQAVLNNGTLTVTTTQPGQVSGYVSGLTSEQKASVTSIVLIGKFNDSDLSAIGQGQGYNSVIAVIMSEAQFERTSGESAQNPHRWVKSDAYTYVGPGTHAYVGGSLYQYEIDKAWTYLGSNDPGNATEYATVADMNNAASNSALYAKAKVPQYMYCQMSITGEESWGNPTRNSNVSLGNFNDCPHKDFNPNSPQDFPRLDTCNVGDTALVIYYFMYNESSLWQLVSKSEFDAMTGAVFNNPSQVADKLSYLLAGTDGGTGDSSVKRMWVAVNYTKQAGTKTWTEGTTTEQAGATIGNFAYDDRYNVANMNFADGTWVKMSNGYTYYELQYQSGAWNDVTSSYDIMENNIIGHYDNSSSLPTNDDSNVGKYAIVGGTEKVYNGSSWQEIGASEAVADYSQCKFSYWNNTIRTAICPTSVDPSQFSSEMLSNCGQLSFVDFGNINVTIESGQVFTYSADVNLGTLQYNDLRALLTSHGSNSDPNNGTVFYGDNINTVAYDTNSDGTVDFTMSFSGSAADRTVVLTNAGENSVSVEQKYAKTTANCKTMVFVGKFNGLNSFDLSNPAKQHTTLDFSEAIIDNNQFQLDKWKSTVTKIVFAEGEATIGGTTADGSTLVTIKADSDAKYATVKGYMTANGTYQEGTGSSYYTYEARKNLTVETNYDNPTNLVIGTGDTDNIFAAEIAAILDKSATGVRYYDAIADSLTTAEHNPSGYTTITFADGSVYNKATGVLDCSASSNMDYDKLEAWLKANNLTVSSIKLGTYVSIVGGVTIIDNTTDAEAGRTAQDPLIDNNLSTNTNLTNAEKKAIRRADNLKLNGKFTNDDFLGLKNAKGGQDANQVSPTRLDISTAILAQDQKLPTDWAGTVSQIILPEHFYDFDNGDAVRDTIPAGLCENYVALTNISIPYTIKKVGNMAFRGCTHLTDVDWGTNNEGVTGIEDIGAHAFERCGFGSQENATKAQKTLTIPNTVKYIREWAFRDCSDINYLYITEDSQLERVESQAFFNDTPTSVKDGLKEVHVDCQHFIWCDVDVFDDSHTNGHSDVATAKCRLFYPYVGVTGYDANYPENVSGSDNDSFNDFVGSFKTDCFNGVMTQADLNLLKTVVESGGTGKDGKHYGPFPGHGWFMFSSTGIGISKNATWRTYSEAVPFKVPSADIAKFYLVCDYNTSCQTLLVQMTPGDVVPANTGVLIEYTYTDKDDDNLSNVIPLDYVSGNTDAPYLVTDEGVPTYYVKGGRQYKNYLRKINNETIRIDCVETKAGTTYRNFFFGNVDWLKENDQWISDDFNTYVSVTGWAFIRSISGSYKVNNKAYLHLPETKAGSGAHAGGTGDGTENGETISSNSPFGLFVISDDDDSATDIKVIPSEVISEIGSVNDNNYYTLSGQRLTAPTEKGIYIHKGKKIVVK